jgi:hypothetical protein
MKAAERKAVDGEYARMRDEIAKLRKELETRAFHNGGMPGFKHIEYCDFCSYAREWIAQYGHGKDCLLRATDNG